MLILVGVTINFTINGGIIEKAKTASNDMQKKADKEELQLAVVASTDYITGKVVRTDLVSSLSSGWNVSNDAPYTCTSPNGNIFTVTEEGVITESGESSGENSEEQEDQDLDLIRDYFLGTDRAGIQIFNTIDSVDINTNTVIFKNDENSITDASTTLHYIDSEGPNDLGNNYFFVEYNDKQYRIAYRDLTLDVADISYNKNGNVGKTATIDGKKYVVLYDAGEHGDYVQLVSANILEDRNVSIGDQDNLQDWNDSAVISRADRYSDTESRSIKYIILS